MAKARVTLICDTCHKEYERTATRYNRKQANEWVEWISYQPHECPSCYGKRMQQEEFDRGPQIHVLLSGIMEDPAFYLVLFGDMEPLKDILSATGFYFCGYYPHRDFLLGDKFHPRRWVMKIPVDVFDPLRAIHKFFQISEYLGQLDFAISTKDILNLDVAGFCSRCQRMVSRGPMPVLPQWMPDGYWNHLIYGMQQSCIYVNGQQHMLSSDQHLELRTYLNALEAWQKGPHQSSQNVSGTGSGDTNEVAPA